MMQGFAVYDCTILRAVASGFDSLGNVTYTDQPEQLAGVLVTPGAMADLDAERQEGVTKQISVHIPKSYQATLHGCRIRFNSGIYAGTWRVIGESVPYMPENTPGRWNRSALAVQVNG